MRTLPNSLALLLFSALVLVGAVVLLLNGDQVPDWMPPLAGAGVLGGAAVMTPGLSTVEKVLASVATHLNTAAALSAPQTPATASPASSVAFPSAIAVDAPLAGLTPADLAP